LRLKLTEISRKSDGLGILLNVKVTAETTLAAAELCKQIGTADETAYAVCTKVTRSGAETYWDREVVGPHSEIINTGASIKRSVEMYCRMLHDVEFGLLVGPMHIVPAIACAFNHFGRDIAYADVDDDDAEILKTKAVIVLGGEADLRAKVWALQARGAVVVGLVAISSKGLEKEVRAAMSEMV